MKDSHLTLTLKKFNSFEEGIFSKKKQRYSLRLLAEAEKKESGSFMHEQPIDETYKL